MKYIVVTEVDHATKIPCTVEPMRWGPVFPDVKGLAVDWADESDWPIALNQEGVYLTAPRYYATCDDDADLNVAGVLEEITASEWTERKRTEFIRRKPFASWVWDDSSMVWNPPVAYPEGAEPYTYEWNEETTSWELID